MPLEITADRRRVLLLLWHLQVNAAGGGTLATRGRHGGLPLLVVAVGSLWRRIAQGRRGRGAVAGYTRGDYSTRRDREYKTAIDALSTASNWCIYASALRVLHLAVPYRNYARIMRTLLKNEEILRTHKRRDRGRYTVEETCFPEHGQKKRLKMPLYVEMGASSITPSYQWYKSCRGG